jgi:hypothetical protein
MFLKCTLAGQLPAPDRRHPRRKRADARGPASPMTTPFPPPPDVADVQRNTAETQITVRVNLDGSGQASAATGIGFFDHMLDQIARHGLIDLDIQAKGDLHIDGHHTVEDVGITLGPGLCPGRGRQEGHPPLRPRLRAAGRGASPRGGRFFRPPRPAHGRALHRGMIGQLRHPAGVRVFPGLCQPRRRDAAHRQPARARTRTTSAKPCSRPSPVPAHGARARPAPGRGDSLHQRFACNPDTVFARLNRYAR